jgi:hypothetical protein
MRAALGRSLAAGAHALWRPAPEEPFPSAPPAANARRVGSARGSPYGANRPASAAVDRGAPHAARAANGARPNPALRGSSPSPALAWPPTARAAVAAPSADGASTASPVVGGSRFVGLQRRGAAAAQRGDASGGHARRAFGGGAGGATAAQLRAVAAAAAGAGAGSAAISSLFALQGNPWAPHIMCYVQARLRTCARPHVRTSLAATAPCARPMAHTPHTHHAASTPSPLDH